QYDQRSHQISHARTSFQKSARIRGISNVEARRAASDIISKWDSSVEKNSENEPCLGLLGALEIRVQQIRQLARSVSQTGLSSVFGVELESRERAKPRSAGGRKQRALLSVGPAPELEPTLPQGLGFDLRHGPGPAWG